MGFLSTNCSHNKDKKTCLFSEQSAGEGLALTASSWSSPAMQGAGGGGQQRDRLAQNVLTPCQHMAVAQRGEHPSSTGEGNWNIKGLKDTFEVSPPTGHKARNKAQIPAGSTNLFHY